MVNWFEQYYDSLISYATNLIFTKELWHLEPSDLVNDAYIKFVESEKDFDEREVKKIIYALGFDGVATKQRERAIGEKDLPIGGVRMWSKRVPAQKGDICCSFCHEVKPIGAFPVKKFDGYCYVGLQCTSCATKKKKEWFANNREKWNTYNMERRGGSKKRTGWFGRPATPIHDLVKKAMKKYYDKNKEDLTDVYIVKLIKHKYKAPTQEQIAAKREQLFAKRRQRAA